MARGLSERRVEDLILVRAFVPLASDMSTGWFADRLRRYASPSLDDAEWDELIASRLAQLVAEGFLELHSHRLTDRGVARVRAFFGGRLPGRGTRWSTIVDAWIPAVALGCVGDPTSVQRLARADGFRATLVQRREKLAIPSSAPTERRVLDALVWRALGVETDEPLTIQKLHAFVVSHALDNPSASSLTELLNVHAARCADLPPGPPDELRSALGRRLIVGPTDRPPSAAADTGAGDRAAPDDAEALSGADGTSLDRFAARVELAARSPSVQRFGPHRAFICSVFESLPDEGDLHRFKTKLVEAHETGRLRLGAASLIDAMDPDLVRRSELRLRGQPHHFVEVD